MNNSSPSSPTHVRTRIGADTASFPRLEATTRFRVCSFPPGTVIPGWFEPAEPVRKFLRALILSCCFMLLVGSVTLTLLSFQVEPMGTTDLLMISSTGALAGFGGGAAMALYDDWVHDHRKRWLLGAGYGASLWRLVLVTWRN